MKHYLLAVALICFGSPARAYDAPMPAAPPAPKPYFLTILRDYAHPKMSASLLYTSKLDFDGGVTDVALIYHKADPTDTLWPQAFQDLGMPPLSWTLLELGFGGNRQSAFLRGGVAVDVAPSLLSPLKDALHRVGGLAGRFGSLLVAENGTGLKLSIGWKTTVLQNGARVRLDDLRFPPRYGIGYTYQF